MQRVIKTAKVVRNNWKKSVFASGLAAWGGKWAYDRHVEFGIMQAYCEEAIHYGQVKIPALSTPRHVTVILNPAANKKGSKADYEKYCDPLLHMAGLKVSVIHTEAEGQAKDLMEIMDNTDCVLIAGGDGTVHEAITGLLRRQDSARAVKAFPVGIAPLGKRNEVARRLGAFQTGDRKAKMIGESTMCLVREVLHDVNVMKISGNQGRPVYSLGSINIGQLRNTFAKINEYWYFGDRAKPYLTFFFQSFRNLSQFWNADDDVCVEFTGPCSGCSKCVEQIFPTIPDIRLGTDKENRRWWHSLLSRRVDPKKKDWKELEKERMMKTDNPECDQWKEVKLNAVNLMIQNDLDNGRLLMMAHNDMGTMDFVKEGVGMTKNIDYVKQNVEDSMYPVKTSGDSVADSEKEISKKKEFLTSLLARQIKLELTAFADENVEENGKIEEIDMELSNEQSLSENVETLTELSNEVTENVEQSSRKRHGIRELDIENKENNVEKTEITEENPENKDMTEDKNEDEGEDSRRWLYIDNENYEIPANLTIELLQRRLQIYYPMRNQVKQ